MLSRRNLRIKVMQAIYALSSDERAEFISAKNVLLKNIDNAYRLYFLQVLYLMKVGEYVHTYAEKSATKLLKTDSDLNVSTRIAKNKVLTTLVENERFSKVLKDAKLRPMIDQDLVKKLFHKLIETDDYKRYTKLEQTNRKEDIAIIEVLLKKVFFEHEDLHAAMDEHFINTADDLDAIHFTLFKFISNFQESKPHPFLKGLSYWDEEKKFALELFDKTYEHRSSIEERIKKKLKNWEFERVAKMDNILMTMSIVELQHFPTIPIKVTINEYIDIAKFYSTPKSKDFINGIVDRTMREMKANGEIVKTGRGLVEF